MSFKDGIPLLTTLDDEDGSDEDFSIEVSSRRTRWGRKHLLFSVILALVVFVLVAVIVCVTVPVVVLQGGKNAGSNVDSSKSNSSLRVSSASLPASPSSHPISTPSSSTFSLLSQSTSTSTSSWIQHPTSTSTSSTPHRLPSTPSQMQYPTPTPSQSTPTLSPTPSPIAPSQCDRVDDCKPVLDDRSYKILTLSNSLRVLLISDPKSNISAASMEVAAGSFSDPPDAEGLAHFCEHMLFLGTKKYPNEHVYSSYLSSHGGYDNAFTSTQETNYYFKVDAAHLERSLDLFAQFFIAPLFANASVEDEVHAVNAEHEKNLQSDAWKLWQLLKHVSNPNHPFHMFSTGTLSTLNSSRVHLLQYLKDYYNSNYSANTLQLAVYGRDSIETLTNWTETYFTDVPDHSITPQTFTTTAFPPEYSGKLVFYYPVADTNTLSLYWQTPPLESHYRNDITDFLSRYLGYEGPGSILYYLKSQSWANSLSAGTEVDADSFSLLVVSIDVTEEGMGHVSEIVHSVFRFIRLLSYQSDYSLQMLWRDYIRVSQVIYDYSEPAEPSDYAQNLAQRMRLVTDPADFLGNPRHLVLNTSLIRTVLGLLSPGNSLVFIGTHSVNFSNSLNLTLPHREPPPQDSPVDLPWPSLNLLEPIYSTPFAELNITSNLTSCWSGGGVGVEFHLPGENSYIPQDFDILPLPPSHTDSPIRVNLAQSTSVKSGVSLWWLQDTTFQTPHVNMYCTMEASQPNTRSVRWSELTTLYTLLVTEVLTPILYPATELTYSTSLFATPTGLHFSFSGFSDPQVMETFIKTTVTYMKNFTSMTKRVFDAVTEDRIHFLQNYNYTTLPYRYISRYLQQVIMERPYWKHEEEVEETRNISLDDVIEHAEMLFTNASFLCFAHGNIDKEQAARYTELVVTTLSPTLCSDPAPHGNYQRQRVTLSQPGNYSVTLPTLNPSDQNSAVNVVYQIGPTCDVTNASVCSSDSITTATKLGLLSQLFGDQCFYQLRTVEQLGYVVFCFQANYAGIGSFQVVVQSQEYNTSYVLGEIDRFMENFTSTIDHLTEFTLNAHKKSYASTLQQKSQTLSEESDRLWEEITTGREQFDYNNQLLEALHDINTQDMQQFYTRYITDSTQYKKLVLGVYGEDKAVNFSQDFSYCIDYNTLDHAVSQYPTSDHTSCAIS